MNELELCLELLKLAISGQYFARLYPEQKGELIIAFQNIYKIVNENGNPAAKTFRAYRLSAKGELNPKNETNISNFLNLEMLNSNSEIEINKPGEPKNRLLNSAVLLVKYSNQDKLILYVHDPNGKDNQPAASFQLSDADEIVLFAHTVTAGGLPANVGDPPEGKAS